MLVHGGTAALDGTVVDATALELGRAVLEGTLARVDSLAILDGVGELFGLMAGVGGGQRRKADEDGAGQEHRVFLETCR